MGGFEYQEAEVLKEWMEMNGEDTSNVPPYRERSMNVLSHLAGQFLAFGIIAALCNTITVRTPIAN